MQSMFFRLNMDLIVIKFSFSQIRVIAGKKERYHAFGYDSINSGNDADNDDISDGPI